MPSKKKKYNARFPAGRIKKIMQSDEEVGKVAQAVPIIIFIRLPRTLELFVESLLTKTLRITNARAAKTMCPMHIKQCIMGESKFDFLKEIVKYVPDVIGPEEMATDDGSASYPASGSSNASIEHLRTHDHFNGDGTFKIQNQNTPHIEMRSLDRNFSLDERQLSLSGPSTVDRLIPNFYTELDSSSAQNRGSKRKDTTDEQPAHHRGRPRKLPKVARVDSAPSNLNSFNQVNGGALNQRNSLHPQSSADSYFTSFKINIPSANAPVQISLMPSTSTTTNQLNTPPVVKADVCNTPLIKIDYSKLTLSQSVNNQIMPTSNLNYAKTEMIESKGSRSKANIDIKSAPATPLLNPLPPSFNSGPMANDLGLDEDYDN